MDAPKCIDCHAIADWHCYRCKAFICEACAKENGGWCQTCTRDTARPKAHRSAQTPGEPPRGHV